MGNIILVKGNILNIEADAIVNSINRFFELDLVNIDDNTNSLEWVEIKKSVNFMKIIRRYYPVGSSAIATANVLPSKYLIHAITPIWEGGVNHEEEVLKNTYESCFENIEKYDDIKTISFPCIGTGIFNFPKDKAANIALNAIKKCVFESKNIEKVIIVCCDDQNYEIYRELLKRKGL